LITEELYKRNFEDKSFLAEKHFHPKTVLEKALSPTIKKNKRQRSVYEEILDGKLFSKNILSIFFNTRYG
jgi:hypothetical protein